MKPIDTLVELNSIFNSEDFSNVVFSLKLNNAIWLKVSEDTFITDFSIKHGNDPFLWNPGLIGLFSITQDQLVETISIDPLEPILPELRQQASTYYQRMLKTEFSPTNLAESTYLAIALRERKRLTGNWNGLLSEIVRSSTNHSFLHENWLTPFAVLMSWFVSDTELLDEILLSNNYLTEIDYFDFVTRILLSQQSAYPENSAKLFELLKAEDFPGQVNWLNFLSTIDERLAQDYSQKLISTYVNLSNDTFDTQSSAYSQFLQDLAVQSNVADPLISRVFNPDFSTLDQWITLFSIAKDEKQYDALLDYKNQLLNTIQSGIEAHKLRKISPSLSAEKLAAEWKAIIEKTPQSDMAKAEYALCLINNDLPVNPVDFSLSRSDEPLVLLTQALMVNLEGDNPKARELVQSAINLSLGKNTFGATDIERFVQIINKLGFWDLNRNFLLQLSEKNINQNEVYSQIAEIDAQIGDNGEAIKNASIALSFNPANRPTRRLLAKLYERGNNLQKSLLEWEKLLQDTNNNDPVIIEDQIGYSKCAIVNGQEDQAILACESLIADDPSNGEAYSILGDAHTLKNDLDKAAGCYQKAISLSPENDIPWIKLAEYRTRSGEKEAVVDLLSTAINACPNSTGLLSLLSSYYVDEGSYAKSLPYLKKCNDLDPYNPQFALKYGTTLQIVGQGDEGEEVIRKALADSPESYDLLSAYTNLLISNQRKEKAIEPLTKLVSMHPVDIKPYLDLAEIALQFKGTNNPHLDLENVESLLSEGLKQNPQNVHGRLLQAELLASIGREESAKDLYVALSEDTNLPSDARWKVNYGLGLISTKLGQMDIALAALEEAGSQNPENFEIHQKLAETYLSANLSKAAVNSAQAALAIAPANADNLIWYSDFCTKMGDFPEALSSLDSAIKQLPENTELRLKLGELQLRMNDLDAAKSTFQQMVAHGKLSPQLIRQVSKNLIDCGEIEEGIRYLEFGIEKEPTTSLPLLLDLVKYEEKSGNFSKAVSSIEKAISLDPENVDLKIIMGDLFAHSGQYDQALIVFKDIKTILTLNESEETDPKYFSILIRQAYLNRKNGDLIGALSNIRDALLIKSDNEEALFLGADISFNSLDFVQALTYQSRLEGLGSDLPKPYELLASALNGMIKIDTSSETDSDQALLSIEFPDRWFHWKMAVDVFRDHKNNIPSDYNEFLAELEVDLIDEIYSNLPIDDFRSNSVPWMNIYNPVLTSPTLLYVLLNASMKLNGFSSAKALLENIEGHYPLEPSAKFYRIKVLALQAENYRYYETLKIVKHLPSGDVANVTALDQYNQSVLDLKHYRENEYIQYWENRGTTAFQPTIENINAILESKSPISKSIFEIRKMAEENDIAGIEEIAKQVVEDDLASYAAFLISDKAPAKAFELIESKIDSLDKSPVQLAQTSFIAKSAGEYEIALTFIEKALEKWPNEPAWHRFAAQICIDLDNTSSALYHLKIAADLEPDDLEAVLEYGETSLKMGDLSHAIQYLKSASAIDPTNHLPWLLLAKAYQVKGDNLQALAHVERAITLAPTNIAPLILSAELSNINGQPDLALKKVDSALRIDSKNIVALVIKVRSLLALDQPQEAMKLIDYSIKKVSKPLPLLIEKAEAIRVLEGEKAYLNFMQKVADDYPRDPEILRRYSLALAENGNASEALNVTQLSLKINPDQSDMHILAGRLLRANGQLDQALDHLSEAISQDTSNVDGYLELAKTYQERRDFTKAIAVYQQAIEIMPRDHRPYYLLGMLLKDSKDYRAAETMLRKAAEYSKDDVNILRQLGAIIAINLVHTA